MYDGLSRLRKETNPETGTITYGYDLDSNLLTRTAPAPNQTGSATVITTLTYDAGHRPLTKTFSDSTPSATFTYDLSSVDGFTILNPKGRLVKAERGTNRIINSYDVMGRVQDQRQQTAVDGSNWLQFTYGHNLAGAPTSWTNGVGVTFTQSFNNAGQVTQLTSSLSDAQHPGTLVSGIQYNEVGGLKEMTYGNGLAMSLANNKR